MAQDAVTLSAIGDDDEEILLGQDVFEEGSEDKAREMAMEKFWDDRLDAGSCSAAFGVEGIVSAQYVGAL